MARVRYETSPDGHVDLDYGSSPVASTMKVSVLAPEFAADQGESRQGYFGLDEMVTQDGRPRPSQDRDQAVRQGKGGTVGAPRKARKRREADVTRAPLSSSRQSNDRSRVKNRVQYELATTQGRGLAHLIESPQRWTQVNDVLSEQAGEAHWLPELRLRQIQRADRAIQAYETASDRSHVLYANWRRLPDLNVSHLQGCVRSHLGGDSVQTVGRFTGAAHCRHEVDLAPGQDTARTIALEVSTRRRTYLGRSDSADDISRPPRRGTVLQEQGLARAAYARPDATAAEEYVLQMTDTRPPPKKGEAS